MAKNTTSEDGARSLRRLFIPRAKVMLAFLVVGLLGWSMHKVWLRVSQEVINRDRYLLSADRISISPSPEWIQSDVRAEVIQNANLDRRLSVLDNSFMQVIEDAFVLHPWIATVDRIEKSFPPGVDVALTYRKPVAVIEMATQKGVQFIPIDQEAVHLPPRDVPHTLKQYLPHIGGIVELPPVGQKWVDERVTGSAKLAVELKDYWKELHLVDILPSARPEIRGENRFFVFELITRGGTRIVWGAAPNADLPGEDKFAQKLDRLRQCIATHGSLDSEIGPAEVDVRRGLSITPRTVKKPSEVKQAAKKTLKHAAKEKKSETVLK